MAEPTQCPSHWEVAGRGIHRTVRGGTLTLQLAGSATQFENLTSYGVINVSDMTISLPTVGAGAGEPEEMIRA